MIGLRTGLVILALGFGGSVKAECRTDRVELRNESAQVRFDVELAITPEEKSRGLMFRENMPARAGMLFVYERPQPVAFWMKNTLIPLDIIFIDETGVILHVHEGAIPGDLTPIDGGDSVFAVLEINAGLAARYGIQPGTQMRHEIFSQGPAIWAC